MFKYFIRRILLLFPTFIGITFVFFSIIHLAPGGPIERKIAEMRFAQGTGDSTSSIQNQEVSKEFIQMLEKQYGLDKPLHVRYFIWLKNLVRFDFGDSFTYEESALDVILSKIPVSLQFGILAFLLSYLISIPLGLLKAIKDQSSFDYITTFVLVVFHSVPVLILGIIFKTYLTGGDFVDWFPPGDLYSDDYFDKPLSGRITDRIHHFVLPFICYVLGAFTTLTLLMKNSLLECIKEDYIRTAYAKGLDQKIIVFKHAFKNALIPLITGIGDFLHIFLAGSLIIEKIFNLDGMGLLAFNAATERDFPILLGLLFFQALFSLAGRLISDLGLSLVNPRVVFTK